MGQNEDTEIMMQEILNRWRSSALANGPAKRRIRVKAWREHHTLRNRKWMPTIDLIISDLEAK
jgi:hypothetical protein